MRSIVIVISFLLPATLFAQDKLELKYFPGVDSQYYRSGLELPLYIDKFTRSITAKYKELKIKWAHYGDTLSHEHNYKMRMLLKRDTVRIKADLPALAGIYEMEMHTIDTSFIHDSTRTNWHADTLNSRYKIFINQRLGRDSIGEDLDSNASRKGLVVSAFNPSYPPDNQKYWPYLDSFITRMRLDSLNSKFDSAYRLINDTINKCAAGKKNFLQYAIVISNQAASDVSFLPRYSTISIVIDPFNFEKSNDSSDIVKDQFLEVQNTLTSLLDMLKIADSSCISATGRDLVKEYVASIVSTKNTAPDVYWSKGFLNGNFSAINAWKYLHDGLNNYCKVVYAIRRKSYLCNQLIFLVKKERK